MHKFYFICKCIKESSVYGIKLGLDYEGEGVVYSNGRVEYNVHAVWEKCNHMTYSPTMFGEYFEITSAS